MKSQPTIVVIGAGPAGLAAGYELVKNGYKVIIFEKEDLVGGIAKTIEYKGYRFDLGGHRFFTKNKEVMDIWKSMLKENFLKVKRMSRIYYANKFFFYPIKLSNVLINLGPKESVRIITSWMYSQLFPQLPEDTFEKWVTNRFGKRLFQIFFKTYTEKVWGIPCDKISSDWAEQRIRGLSLLSVVKNSIFKTKNRRGKIKTLIEEFYYPIMGPGMMWDTFWKFIEDNGGKIVFNTSVENLIIEKDKVKAVKIMDKINNKSEEIECDFVISSMPLKELILKMTPSVESKIIKIANSLSYRSFLIVSLIIDKKEVFPDNWIYIHSPEVKVGRIQNFKNWSLKMVPDINKTCLGLEYFCSEGDTLWNSNDEILFEIAKEEIEKLKFARKTEIIDYKVVKVPKAYPVYDTKYKENIEVIKNYLKPISNLQTVGRGGMHRYNNQDHSMLSGMFAARNILGENYNIWAINADAEYLEEEKI